MTVIDQESYSTSYTYDQNNRLLYEIKTTAAKSEQTTYQYDDNGNLSSWFKGTLEERAATPVEESASYTYDAYNRLTDFSRDDSNACHYGYNGDNLRIFKDVNGYIRKKSYWDGSTLAAEIQANVVYKYYHGLTGIMFSKTASVLSGYYYKNAHGDVTAVADGNQNVTQTYTYDAFGNQLSQSNNDTNPFRYCGEYFDTESNQIYLRNRYYDTSTGRFITEDPIRDGANWYVYCVGNPVLFVDSTGFAPEDHKEFGNGVVTRKLDELGEMWMNSKSVVERSELHEYAELIRGLERLRKEHGLQKYPLGYKYNTVSALETQKKYVPTIKRTSKLTGVPENMIYSILFREMMCFKADDYLDSVKEVLRGDASLGLGQIFIHTALEAERFRFGDVIHSWDDMKNLLLDNTTNIYYVGLVLLHAGSMVGIHITSDYNFDSIEKVFARYNGTNEAAAKYGKETAQYFEVYTQHGGGLS